MEGRIRKIGYDEREKQRDEGEKERKKNNAGHRGKEKKSVPFGDPRDTVLNKYIIMLACRGAF